MTANTPSDYDMKVGLLDDTFTVLDLEKMYDYFCWVIDNIIDCQVPKNR